jgi:hypothetical protein
MLRFFQIVKCLLEMSESLSIDNVKKKRFIVEICERISRTLIDSSRDELEIFREIWNRYIDAYIHLS